MYNRTLVKQRKKLHVKKTLIHADRPRLTVFRSNTHIYAQVIDDVNHVTLASANDTKDKTGTNVERAIKVGTELAKIALKAGVTKVVFDRSGYKFHGRVKSLAQGARDGGLEF